MAQYSNNSTSIIALSFKFPLGDSFFHASLAVFGISLFFLLISYIGIVEHKNTYKDNLPLKVTIIFSLGWLSFITAFIILILSVVFGTQS